jgi:hypothetical protein
MSTAPRLHPDIEAFLALGLSMHVGACSAAGQPQLTRALAVRARDDGAVELLVPSVAGAALIAAVHEAGQVATVFCQPTTHRTLQLKGRQAVARPASPADWPQLPHNRQAFADEIEAYGFDEAFCAAWFGVADDSLHSIVFRPTGAWNQTPGPAAGAPIQVHAE